MSKFFCLPKKIREGVLSVCLKLLGTKTLRDSGLSRLFYRKLFVWEYFCLWKVFFIKNVFVFAWELVFWFFVESFLTLRTQNFVELFFWYLWVFAFAYHWVPLLALIYHARESNQEKSRKFVVILELKFLLLLVKTIITNNKINTYNININNDDNKKMITKAIIKLIKKVNYKTFGNAKIFFLKILEKIPNEVSILFQKVPTKNRCKKLIWIGVENKQSS